MKTLSVTMPIYNRAHLLRRSLYSLTLWHPYPPDAYEIIVADDRSDDREALEAVIEEFATRVNIKLVDVGWYRPEEINGNARARNAALRHARGDVIVITEPEILHLTGSLMLTAQAQKQGDNIIGACGLWWKLQAWPADIERQEKALEGVDPRDEGAMRAVFQELTRDVRPYTHLQPGKQVFLSVPRRLIIDELNGYDERFTHWGAEDQDMFGRLQRAGGKLVGIGEMHCVHMSHRCLYVTDPDAYERQVAILSERGNDRRNPGTWLGGSG